MGKLVIGFLILVTTVFAINQIFWPKKNQPLTQTSDATAPLPSITPTPQNQFDITWNSDIYRISWFLVPKPNQISLIPNFDKQQGSQEFKKSFACNRLINGGFYTPENLPLGHFRVDGNQLGEATSNSLFNGFFSLSEDRAQISTEFPPSDHRIQLQSGPVLVLNTRPITLRLRTDENARRSFVALNSQGHILFGTIYDPDEVYNGPLLEDMPEILGQFSTLKSLNLISALNLDGGSASVYADEYIFLGEITSVGSFFCIE